MIAGRIWWWDEFEWQKCVPSVINNVGHTPKNATMKNFTSTDFLGPIRFDSPNGGTSNSWIKKTWTLPLTKLKIINEDHQEMQGQILINGLKKIYEKWSGHEIQIWIPFFLRSCPNFVKLRLDPKPFLIRYSTKCAIFNIWIELQSTYATTFHICE